MESLFGLDPRDRDMPGWREDLARGRRPQCPLHPECRFCTSGLFRALPVGALVHTRVTAGAEVLAPGDQWHAVLRVHAGVGAFYRPLGHGQSRIVDFAFPGEVVGVAFAVRPLPVGLKALDAFEFCSLSRGQLDELAEHRPDLALDLWRMASASPDMTLDRFAHLGQQGAEARIARLLLELCVRRTGRWPISAGTEIMLPITQEHVADATGLSTSYVCRTLAEFPRRGILSYRWQKLIVMDPPALLEASGLGSEAIAQWLRRREPLAAPRLEAVG